MATATKEEYEISPTINNILERNELNWIFIGGKGGVGKTTTSCALATIYADRNMKTLLVSTDPAHNISDALNQQIGENETKVKGIENLYALEINPLNKLESWFDIKNDFVSDIIASLPGIDEAISFIELMEQIDSTKYDIIIFDTAPTGHTLKLLGFPKMLEKGIKRLIEFKNSLSGVFSSFFDLMNKTESKKKDVAEVLSKMEKFKDAVEAVNEKFRNPKKTTFVCVCIPEFLSLYETERLYDALDEYQINFETLIVNQVLFPEKGSNCRMCMSRVKMQKKYLVKIDHNFERFSIVTTPLMDNEVRGISSLRCFARYLIEPYQPEI